MPRQRIVKYPPKRGKLSRSKIERAVKEVLEARGVPIEPKRDTYKYQRFSLSSAISSRSLCFSGLVWVTRNSA